MIARELTEFFALVQAGRRVRARRRAVDPADPATRLLLERQLVRAAGVLGAGALPRRRVRGGPGVRARRDGRRLAQGVRPGRRRPARARLSVRGVHAPLLRRVPRAAGDDGPRRAARRPRASRARRARRSRADLRYMREQRAGGGAERLVGAALRAPPRRPRGGLRARLAPRAPAGRAAAAPVARGPRRRDRRSRARPVRGRERAPVRRRARVRTPRRRRRSTRRRPTTARSRCCTSPG